MRRGLSIFATLALVVSTSSGEVFAQPAAAQAPQALVWPPPPAPARIRWAGEYRNAFDVGAKKRRSFIDRLAGKGEDVLWLKRPMSVAVDERGVIYVGDFGQGIVGMDPTSKRMWLFSSVSNRTLGTPSGLATDSRLVIATDSNTNALVAFDKEGRQLAALGATDGLKRPVGVAVDEARDLVVLVNGGDHSVWLLNRALKVVKKIGKRGDKEGQFNFPTYCCIVPGTGFAVADTGNFRVQLFDFNGRFLRAFGKAGDQSGQFARPKGLAVDSDGHLYVVDGSFCNVQVFRTDGQVLTFVGQGGTAKGSFQVPNGIAITKEGGIFVADQLNARIQQFQYLPEPPPQPKG